MRLAITALTLGALAPLPEFRAVAQEGAAARLHALLDEEWAGRLAAEPLLATRVGVHDYDDRLPDVSAAALAARAEAARRYLARLDSIPRDGLGLQDRISYDMLGRELRERVADHELGDHYFPINADSGFHVSFAFLPSLARLVTPADYERYVARLRAFPGWVEQHVELLRAGLEAGYSVPRIALEGYEVTIESHVVDAPEESVFYRPFAEFPRSVPESERTRLRAAGAAAIREAVVPGYRRFLEFMRETYLPGARDSVGASAMPDGLRYYEHLVRRYTTLDVTPGEVHEIGLAEVRRIRAEMEVVIDSVGFAGSFEEFLEHLRSEPRFYASTPEQLLREASWIAKRMDGQLPALFRTLPRQPYTVAPVPDHLAPKYTGGRYVGAPLGGTQPGTYWVNTYALESRPLYTLEALTLHEAVPGHHLQNALRQELDDLPAFRRFGGIGAYGEGWGLYSERLGLEAGFYTDPYSNFGRLTYEMWRACRLVVDTGLHAFGWTRRQTIDYLAANTALSRHECTTETDRYISWPGQALGYKMGELEIRELRRRAEEALGERFDLRAFHDVLLLNGPVPLSILDALVDGFIAEAGGNVAER
jgi:uncharacterized protein (DUF885 family)